MVSRSLLNLLTDLGQLVSDIGVVGGQRSEVNEDTFSLLPAILTSEPAGGFRTDKDSGAEEKTRYELKTKRDDPLSIFAVAYGAV